MQTNPPVPDIRTQADLEAYRAQFAGVTIPRLCERVVHPNYRGEPENWRVTGFRRPALIYKVPAEFRYFAIQRQLGRTLLVRPSGAARVVNTVRLRHRRVWSWDCNEWLRETREEWDNKDREDAAAKGCILLRPCAREEATHVELYAICGTTARIDQVTPTGHMCWGEKAVEEAEQGHANRISRVDRFDIYPSKP